MHKAPISYRYLNGRRKYYSGRDVVFKSFRQSVTLHGAGASPLTDAVECAKFAFVLLERNAAKASSFPSDRVSDENFVVANPYFETGEDAKGKEKAIAKAKQRKDMAPWRIKPESVQLEEGQPYYEALEAYKNQ